MSKNDNSFEWEGCSGCEEDEIVAKERNDTKTKEELREEDDPTKLPNYDLIKSISQTLDTILEDNKKKPNYKEIVKKQSKMAFSANLIPNISIEDYLLRIQEYWYLLINCAIQLTSLWLIIIFTEFCLLQF